MVALATAVGQVLASSGVRHAFGVVGGGNILVVAGLTAAGMDYLPARHEGGAMAMADAYHRVTGEVAVCTTSHGPGLTNVATGLVEAVKHGSGVLVLCGDRPSDRTRRHDIDQRAFAEAAGAPVRRVTDPATALTTVAGALRLARTDQCPVVLCLPNDLLPVPVPAAAPAAAIPSTRRQPGAAELDAVLAALARSRRPLLLAGLGAWRSGAVKPMVDLADRLGALLATTAPASGLFAGHPWSLGTFGGFASPRAASIIGAADLILAFGASLDPFTLHHGALISPNATVVQVDRIGPPSVERVDLALTADATAAAVALLDGVTAGRLVSSSWRAEVATEIKRVGWEHEPYEDASTGRRIDPRTLSQALGKLLPAERTLILDGGHFIGWPSMYWPVPDPSGLVFIGAAFQTVGLGFAGGVGAAVGRPDRVAVVALGDGGSLMGLSELETLIRTRLPALVVIYDDAAYGFEVHMYGRLGADLDTATFADTDFAGLARSLGAAAVTVRTLDDLAAVAGWVNNGCPGTLVLDCKVVPGVIGKFLADLITSS